MKASALLENGILVMLGSSLSFAVFDSLVKTLNRTRFNRVISTIKIGSAKNGAWVREKKENGNLDRLFDLAGL